MGPTCVLSAPDGPHVGLMNLAIREVLTRGQRRGDCFRGHSVDWVPSRDILTWWVGVGVGVGVGHIYMAFLGENTVKQKQSIDVVFHSVNSLRPRDVSALGHLLFKYWLMCSAPTH